MFARCRASGDRVGQTQQAIGFTAHGRNHHDQIMALIAPCDDFLGNVFDPLDICDRRAAVFLYD